MLGSLDALARESVALFEHGDWAAIRELSAPDRCYEEPPTGRRIEGVDAVLSALRARRAAFSDLTGEITRLLTDGDTAVLEIVWRGTHSGVLGTSDTRIPPSGRRIACWATLWLRWDGSRVTHERNHVDALTLLGQVGALVTPATWRGGAVASAAARSDGSTQR